MLPHQSDSHTSATPHAWLALVLQATEAAIPVLTTLQEVVPPMNRHGVFAQAMNHCLLAQLAFACLALSGTVGTEPEPHVPYTWATAPPSHARMPA